MTRPSPLVKTRPTGHERARGLVSDPESGRRITAHAYAPGENLSDVVACYWVGRWDLRGQAPHQSQLLGDPCVHLVFELGGEHAGARLVGVWTKLWRRTLKERGLVRAVKLRPGAARAFLSEPVANLTNRIVPLASVFGDLDELTTSVLSPELDAVAFASLAHWLERRRLDAPQLSLAVAIVERIAADPSITRVERLVEVSGVDKRSLQRLFREYVGAAPKWVIRRNRLQEAALRIESGRASNLTRLALELGYTDQAHLSRDFKSAVGASPRDFAARVSSKRGPGR